MAEKLILLRSDDITAGTKELAKRLTRLCESWNKEIVVVGILKGCVWFYSDLTSFLPQTLKFRSKFIEISAYEGQIQTDHVLSTVLTRKDFEGKKVVLVDELYDNGSTFEVIKRFLDFVPKEDITTVCLMRKDKENRNPLPDLYAFVLPNVWLVGYGLDDEQHFRHWKNVYAYKKSKKEDETPGDDIFYSESFYNHILEDINEVQRSWI